MVFRKVLFFGAAVFFGLAASSARAQFGVYGMYTGTDLTRITCLAATTTPPAACSSPNGNVKPFGGTVGAYYDFHTYGPVRLGVDLRGDFLHANKSGADATGGDRATIVHNVLAGIRGTFHTPISILRPYAQISAGWASSNATEPSCLTTLGTTLLCSDQVDTATPRKLDNFLQVEGFIGADLRVFPILDLRPIELGYGNMNRMGSGNGDGSLGVRSIGAGLVFHLP
jgi:hypothetical protein